MTTWLVLIPAALYGVVLAALFGYSLSCHLLVLLARRARRPTAAPLSEWPKVTVQLPVYNEPEVVERLLRAVAALEYPRPIEVQILDDSTDETSALIARLVDELARPEVALRHIRRAARHGYKAGALAEGLAFAGGDAIAIFDADFVPAPDFLARTVPHLLGPGVCVVQARWTHLNRHESRLTRAQALAIDGHFGVEQAARSSDGFLAAFNGSAGVWRREAIVAAGGWSSDTLTEDLDLSVRAQLAGWRVIYLDDVTVPAELPRTFGALKSQQRRWAQGSTETALKHARALVRAPRSLGARLEALVHLTHYFTQPLILASALLALPIDLLAAGGDRPGLKTLALPLLLASGGPTMLYLQAQRRLGGPVAQRLRDLPWLLLLGTGLAISNTVAVARGLAGSGGAFERTPKGAARPAAGGTALAALEVIAGAGFLLLGVSLIRHGLASLAPFLLLDGLGLAFVGGGSLWERTRRIEAALVGALSPARREGA